MPEQVRSKDAMHTELLLRFSLDQKEPALRKQHVEKLMEQKFDEALLERDPEFWDAPIAVQTNHERHVLSRLRTIVHAKRHNLPVFRWTMPMKNASGDSESYDRYERKYAISSVFVETGAMSAVELEVLFVKGLPVLLTENFGHMSWKLTNNRRGSYHSFRYNDKDTESYVKEIMESSELKGGEIIDIPQPDIVYVQFEKLRSDSENTPTLVVPIRWSTTRDPFKMYLKHAPKQIRLSYGLGRRGKKRLNEEQDMKCIPTVRAHPITSALCFTYNKLQGATIKRLILVLNDVSPYRLGKMCVYKLYVALSRVEQGKHIAVWRADRHELSHLYAQKASDKLVAWHKNYDNNGMWKKGQIHFEDVERGFGKMSKMNEKFKKCLAGHGGACADMRRKEFARELNLEFGTSIDDVLEALKNKIDGTSSKTHLKHWRKVVIGEYKSSDWTGWSLQERQDFLKEQAQIQLQVAEVSDQLLQRMVRYHKDRSRRSQHKTEVSLENEDKSKKSKDELVRELWNAYIQTDMLLTKKDDLVRIGKSLGLTKTDLKTKKNLIKALVPEYLDFLRRERPHQVNLKFIEE